MVCAGLDSVPEEFQVPSMFNWMGFEGLSTTATIYSGRRLCDVIGCFHSHLAVDLMKVPRKAAKPKPFRLIPHHPLKQLEN